MTTRFDTSRVVWELGIPFSNSASPKYFHCCFSLLNRKLKIRVQVQDGVELRLFFLVSRLHIAIIPDFCWNPFISGCFTHRWFHWRIKEKWSRDEEFHVRVMVNLSHRESCFTVCLQLCWVSHFLARYNPRYVTEQSSTDLKSIAWISG